VHDQDVADLAPWPLSRQPQKERWTVETGAKSFGSIRHWQPVDARDRMALTTARKSTARGRPVRRGAGMNGAISAHASSFGSLAYRGDRRA
jgi:hypothetical protein